MRFQYLIQRQSERGIYVVLTALMIAVIMGIVGLAVDVSRHLVVNAELQNSADSCALAGVLELNSASDAPKRAEQAARFVGGLQNSDNFQKQLVFYSDKDITFSVNRDGPYISAATALPQSVYIKCTARQNGLVNMFMGVLGFAKRDLEAVAIATLQPALSVCMVPMSIHAKNVLDPDFGFKKFDIINNQFKTEDGLQNGLLDAKVDGVFNFANPLGNINANANDVKKWIMGVGVCNVPTANKTTCIDEVPTNGVTDAWNSRFGVYAGGLGQGDLPNALPDQTGVAYDYRQIRGSSSGIDLYMDNDAPQKKPFDRPASKQEWTVGGAYYSTGSDLKKYGTTNRRIVGLPVVDPVINCGSGNGHPVVGWACGMMIAPFDNSTKLQPYRVQRIQYLGRADKTPYCGTMGIPGGSDATGPLVPALVQ